MCLMVDPYATQQADKDIEYVIIIQLRLIPAPPCRCDRAGLPTNGSVLIVDALSEAHSARVIEDGVPWYRSNRCSAKEVCKQALYSQHFKNSSPMMANPGASPSPRAKIPPTQVLCDRSLAIASRV